MYESGDKELVRAASSLRALLVEDSRVLGRDKAFCPFHPDKNHASLSLYDGGARFKCFTCGAQGDIFDYVIRRHNLEFPQAIEWLAHRFGVTLTKGASRPDRLREVLNAAQRFYVEQLRESPHAAGYLERRRIGAASCARFGFGWAPSGSKLLSHLRAMGYADDALADAGLVTLTEARRDFMWNRVTLPLRDASGSVVGFVGRSPNSETASKYINTRDTNRYKKREYLFALDLAGPEIRSAGYAVLVEGYLDVVALHSAGIQNVVGLGGTACSLDQLRLISRFTDIVVFCLDSDEAGINATCALLPQLLEVPLQAYAMTLSCAKDPDEYLLSQSPDHFRAEIAEALPLPAFVLRRILASVSLRTPMERNSAHREIHAFLGKYAELFSPFDAWDCSEAVAARMGSPLTAKLVLHTYWPEYKEPGNPAVAEPPTGSAEMLMEFGREPSGWNVADDLARYGDALVPCLATYVSAPDSLSRRQCVYVLDRIKTASAATLLLRFLNDFDEVVRQMACGALGRNGDTRLAAAIAELAEDVSATVRKAALNALAEYAVPETSMTAMLLLADDDPETRYVAARTLLRHGDAGAIGVLEAAASREPKGHVSHAAAAIQAIRRRNGEVSDAEAVSHSVMSLDLSAEVIKVLRRGGIATVGDVLALSKQELLAVRNMSDASVMAVESALSAELPSLCFGQAAAGIPAVTSFVGAVGEPRRPDVPPVMAQPELSPTKLPVSAVVRMRETSGVRAGQSVDWREEGLREQALRLGKHLDELGETALEVVMDYHPDAATRESAKVRFTAKIQSAPTPMRAPSQVPGKMHEGY